MNKIIVGDFMRSIKINQFFFQLKIINEEKDKQI